MNEKIYLNGCEKKIEVMMESKRISSLLFGATLIVTFLYMFFLNSKTPLIADDFVYTFIFGTTTPVNGLEDIVTSQISYYSSWGGRVVAETLTQIFMFLGKDFFNVVNSLCYLVFCLAAYFLAVGRKIRFELLFILTLIIWFFMPMFGQTILWLTGAANYLWCGTLVLLALLPFRFYADEQTTLLKNRWFSVVMSPLFFLSGITNENTGGAMILIMLLFAAVYFKRKIPIPPFVYTGLFFSIAGFCCMIFAPGNASRIENEASVREVAMMVGSNPMVTRLSYFAYNLHALMPLVLVVGIAFVLLRNEKRRKQLLNFYIFVIAAVAAMLVMLFPPKFPPRAMFGLATFLMIAIVYALSCLTLSPRGIRKFLMIPVCIMLLFFGMSLGYVGVDALSVNRQCQARNKMIEEQKGEAMIQVPSVQPLSEHNGMYGLKDVQSDPNHWANRALADYFGVKNIVRKP